MNSKEVRKLYNDYNLSYDSFNSDDISLLVKYIKDELSKDGEHMKMKVDRILKNNISYDKNGKIDYCYITVTGDYFTKREAISFNRRDKKSDGFIGFAGWASTKNTQPFIDAFYNLIENKNVRTIK